MTKTLLTSPFFEPFGFAIKFVDLRGWGGNIQ
jgi:hypothetical protein